jgi:hypothetical protein
VLVLDPALLRPGQLDQKIEIPEPNETQHLDCDQHHDPPHQQDKFVLAEDNDQPCNDHGDGQEKQFIRPYPGKMKHACEVRSGLGPLSQLIQQKSLQLLSAMLKLQWSLF